MYIEKIFHLRQPLNEARERLRSAVTWTASEEDALVHCAANDSEVFGHLEIKSRHGEPISADIEEVLGDESDRILFRSTHGDVELVGVIELFLIRPNLTEAVLSVEYEAATAMQKAIDRISVGIDQFLNRQLARIERVRVGEAVGLCA